VTWNGKTTAELGELFALLREHNVEAIEVDGLKIRLAAVYPIPPSAERGESPFERAERVQREYDEILFAHVGGPPPGGES
jgi:hypothetical protein